jgi:hypothetical protein
VPLPQHGPPSQEQVQPGSSQQQESIMCASPSEDVSNLQEVSELIQFTSLLLI